MGNSLFVTRKAASKKQKNEKILEFGVPVLANGVLEKDELKPFPVQALKIDPEAESVVVGERCSCRIKLVITKQQLRELVSKRISVQDIIELRKVEKWCSCWRPELEPIPEENEIGCFL